jgi:hypothetical protein
MDQEAQDRQEFLALLESRLAQGQRDYGNASFYKTHEQLRNELLMEYLDVAGWAYISWRKAKRKLEDVQQQFDQLG